MAFAAKDPASARLRFRAVDVDDASELHALAVDPHIRRFLFDGEIVPRSWADGAVEKSRSEPGVGLWLLYARSAAPPIGFAGFWRFEVLGPEPQLVYALRAEHTGKGLAREAAAALAELARAGGTGDLHAAVDEPNVASIRVLEQLGFERYGEAPGHFGRTHLFRLPADRPPRGPHR
jgi:[ribosomal protein S5]-alanine N-acetyltransferase